MNFDLLDEILNYYDEPLGDSSMLPTFLVSRLTKNHVTVALGGDGGDELFGGYTSYRDIIKQDEVLNKVPDFIKECAGKIGKILRLQKTESIIQDVEIPIEHCTNFINFFHKEIYFL